MTEESKAQRMAEVYETYLIGDHITNEELAFAIEYLDDKVIFLAKMGERFHFVWKELLHFRESLKNYRESRKPAHLQWRTEKVKPDTSGPDHLCGPMCNCGE